MRTGLAGTVDVLGPVGQEGVGTSPEIAPAGGQSKLELVPGDPENVASELLVGNVSLLTAGSMGTGEPLGLVTTLGSCLAGDKCKSLQSRR